MNPSEARLVGTASAPVPPGATVELFEGRGGIPLRAALFPAEGVARGSVVLSPGRTEPIEKYFEVIGELNARGLTVLAHDWRGQGLSWRPLADRMRGHADDWRDYVEDHKALTDAFIDRLPAPRLALAHSMGCCFVILALAGDDRFAGGVFTGPMLGLQTGPAPRWMGSLVAGGMVRLGRSQSFISAQAGEYLGVPFEQNRLTHDGVRWQRHRDQLLQCPELALGNVTWGWVRQAYLAMAEALRLAPTILTPMVLLGAGEEAIVDNAAARAFAARAPHARYVEVPGSRHEIMMETDTIRALFWREFDAMLQRATG